MSLGEVLRERREGMKLTQDQVADRVGMSKPYLSNIETSKVKNPPTDRILKALERVLKFPKGELMKLAHLARTPMDVRTEHEMLEAEVTKLRTALKKLLSSGRRKKSGGIDLDALVTPKDNVRALGTGTPVPIINKVVAGYPQHFTDLDYPASVADEYARCPDVHDPQAFAARVVGDSMEPDYEEGDIVIFSPNKRVRNGDDCFVRFEEDSSTTFKRVYQDGKKTLRLQPLNSRYAAQVCQRDEISGLWPAVFRMQSLRK